MTQRPRRGEGARNRRANSARRGGADHNQSSLSGSLGSRFAVLSEAMGSHRVAIVAVVFFILAAVFFLRLFQLQVILHDDYSAKAEKSRSIEYPVQARRGTIYDRNGVVLATSVESTTITCDPTKVTDASYAASKIAEILGGEAADYEKTLTADSTFGYIKRQVDVDVADQLKSLNITGLYFETEWRREYPNGAVGGQVVGYCNIDGEGITGLELQYNDILAGTDGYYKSERGEDGMPIPDAVIEDTPAVDGQDIMVSIDIKLQDSVEQALAAGVEPLKAEGGSSVVMDAETGEIYAVCSLPYMDPSNMSESEVGSDTVKAISEAFEPGSIFKSVSALAVLESGVMTPEDTLFCPASIQADEYTVSDAHERGDETMSLRQILDNSSNVGISLAVEKMGFDGLVEIIDRYHLNEKTGVDYPGESSGYMQDFNTWAKITGYNVSFGQGISCTPLQMTRFYAAVANDGTMVTPHFLISLPQSGERPTYETEQVDDNQAAIENLRSMMRTVVTEGTGKDANIEGYDVVGKTSTAEIAEGGTYLKNVYNLCFTGFIDNSSSSLVCFVSASRVYGGGSVASIFNDIMSNAIEQYNIVPE